MPEVSYRRLLLLAVVLTAWVLPLKAWAAEGSPNDYSTEETSQAEFFVIESPTVYLGEAERVVVGFSSLNDLEDATLNYEGMESGQIFTANASKVTADGAALFTIDFSSAGQSGRYRLISVDAKRSNGQATEFELTAEATDESTFAFALANVDSSSSVTYCAIGASGELVQTDDVEVAKDVASESSAKPQALRLMSAPARKTSSDPYQKQYLTIALDAGHSNVGRDTGAVGNGMEEQNLTLAIAQAAQESLDSYSNVNVVWCRPSDEFSSTASTKEDLLERVRIAAAANADVYVSFHINASGSSLGDDSTVQGLEIYIPNKQSFHREYFDIGSDLAQRVIDNLTALDLDGRSFVSRGVRTRNYDDGNIYLVDESPDTDQWDYLSVIRNSRSYNIPAILIEHGFIDNGSHDALILSNSENLEKMGQADAGAIAEYYGLGMCPCPYAQSISNGSISIVWDEVSWATKYAVAYREHVEGQSIDSGWKTVAYDNEDTSATIDGLKNGTTYDFLVQGGKENSDGSARWTTYGENDVLTCAIVPTPSVVQATASDDNGHVTLTWEAVDGADAYAIAERTDSGYDTFTLSCSGTSFVTPALSAGKTHKFLVQAHVNGSWSRVSDDLLVSAVPKGAIKPSVTATLSGSSCDLAWGAVPGATRYAVAKLVGSAWQTYTYDCTGTSFRLDGLEPGLEYRFLVQAYVDGSWSAFDDSDVVSVTYKKSNAWTRPKVTAILDGSSCRLTWDALPGATRYAVAKRTDSGWQTYTYNCTNTSFNLSSLEPGRTYQFLVQAYINGEWSRFGDDDVVSVRYEIPHPSVTATLSGSSCDLAWGAVPGATRYAVFDSLLIAQKRRATFHSRA